MQKNRIAVLLSGGVDSAVAAALLVREGHDVVGLFAKTWTPQPGDGTSCTWVADRRDALRVAAHLGIRLVTVDLEQTYRAGIIEPFFSCYRQGLTPNPDVLCNRIIKFGALWDIAQGQGATRIATGHYAQIAGGNLGRKKSETRSKKQREYQLLRGVDPNKDQSYFLWDIPRVVLPFILFPVGAYTKPQVRALARSFGLPVAKKKDSQGICFLGQTQLGTFLDNVLPVTPGPIRDVVSGQVLGRHQGIHHFTLGQRHGLSLTRSAGSAEAPRYVVALDAVSQTVLVGPAVFLVRREVRVTALNWLCEMDQLSVTGLSAQIRYRQSPQPIRLKLLTSERATVVFPGGISAPTPGQSLVIYRGMELLGGGVIESVEFPRLPMRPGEAIRQA